MIFISHRGNLNGRETELENFPPHISQLSQSQYVEIDLWAKSGSLWLGHDAPENSVDHSFFNKNLWVHCKNLEAVNYMSNTKFNWFWHENDKMTITSKGDIWCFPKVYIENGITVMDDYENDLQKIKGICTDYLIRYR